MKRSFILFTVLFYSLLSFIAPALAIETKADQAILIDYESGERLFEKNADMPMVPSSMTKLMTVYIVFDHLKKGVLSLNDTFKVSKKAWQKGGSRMFLELNSSVPIEKLLEGIIVQSGNDACIVVAEGISGTEEAFANIMNETAKEIGLTNSHFTNATGWPDEKHYMSAADIALLSQKLIQNFPEYYHYFSIKELTYNNIKQGNRNILLSRNNEIDGLKTGHTEDGGYGIVISGKNDEGRRQIVVVNGLNDARERASEAENLYNYGQRYFGTIKKYSAKDKVEDVAVSLGEKETVAAITATDVAFLAPKLKADEISYKTSYFDQLEAPITAGQKLGELIVSIPGLKDKVFPLVAAENIEELGWFSKSIELLKQEVGF